MTWRFCTPIIGKWPRLNLLLITRGSLPLKETADKLLDIAAGGNAAIHPTACGRFGAVWQGSPGTYERDRWGDSTPWASEYGGRIQFQTANSGRDIYSGQRFPASQESDAETV